MSELTKYEPSAALVKSRGSNYTINTGRSEIVLRRNTDFGRIPGLDKPSLFKPGAEKVIIGYGLLSYYNVESAIEDRENGFFFYCVKCRLIASRDNVQLCVAEGYGSANTLERRNGNASGFDMANNAIKMAKKRSMVDAALMVGQLSDMFTQDIEDDSFMKGAKPESANPDDPITSKQRQRLFAILGNHGISQEKAKQVLISMGFASTKDIKQKDYDAVCDKLDEFGKGMHDASNKVTG